MKTKYLNELLGQIHDDIQNCPTDSALKNTIKILNILELLRLAVETVAEEAKVV
jgi:hypothetical protein